MVRPKKPANQKVQKRSVSLSPTASAELDRYCARKRLSRGWVLSELLTRFLSKLP